MRAKRRKEKLILYKKYRAENQQRELEEYREKEKRKNPGPFLRVLGIAAAVVLAGGGIVKVFPKLQAISQSMIFSSTSELVQAGSKYELLGDVEVDTQDMYIRGTVLNNHEDLDRMEIVISLYDKDNVKLGDLTATRLNVAKGEQWEFRMELAHTDIDVTRLKYCVYNITGGNEGNETK